MWCAAGSPSRRLAIPLLQAGLFDELHLQIHPVLAGFGE
jgi:hypothetical protein